MSIFENLRVSQGEPRPLGLSWQGGAANFAIFSSHASAVFLGFFITENDKPKKEIPLYRTGNVWHVEVWGLSLEGLYGFRCEGPYDEQKGLLYQSDAWIADPYAKSLRGQTKVRMDRPSFFDWQQDVFPKIPLQELIVYEMHVRGFTKHSSSGVLHPGTYLGVIEKIPFLKKLGVNAVELMPVFEFDETCCKNIHPKTKEPLVNYWGYNPLHFFVPKRGYAVADPVNEFKTMVRELHKHEIEVFLDVVYTHTGEGNDPPYTVNFRGVDNSVYYLLDEQGKYRDFSGCRNTVNVNHPVVQCLILDSLRYWVEEMHVDGFRFDLASIFTRDLDGRPIQNPPILQAIASDPVLNKVKLIAEPWDASGLRQTGSFVRWGPWLEWNDFYRDTVRRFIKGTDGEAANFGSALCGSETIYFVSKTPCSSVNFITSHDGYSLKDLVSYQEKHNEDNGEMNRDGANQNESWNCGEEGVTENEQIVRLRERQMRNFFLALFLSQGVPMIHMGDEYGHTRNGNNNPYVHDNELNWFLWDRLESDERIFQFVASLIAFRKKHLSLRHSQFLTDRDIEWHGKWPNQPDWSQKSRFVAFVLKGSPPLFAAFNAGFTSAAVVLPQGVWRQTVHTGRDWSQHHLLDPSKGMLLPAEIEIPPYSSLLAVG